MRWILSTGLLLAPSLVGSDLCHSEVRWPVAQKPSGSKRAPILLKGAHNGTKALNKGTRVLLGILGSYN